MKKIFILLISFVTGVPCFSWGLHRDFVNFKAENNSADYRAEDSLAYQKSPLYAILRNHKSRFSVCVLKANWTPPPGVEKPEDFGFRLLTANFSAWLDRTRQTIAQTGRNDEFQDVLNWLPTQLQAVRTTCDEKHPADITLDTSHTMGIAGRAGWYEKNQHWTLNLAHGGAGDATAWHELGHFFGLADLGSSYHGNVDERYSLAAVGEVPNAKTGIMWWNGDYGVHAITCDDVEGFLNAVDFVQFMEGETSPRLENGWQSICGKPYVYLRGRVARNAEELAQIKQETEQFRARGKSVAQFQQERQMWLDYLDKKVLPLQKQKKEELASLSRPLNDKGLLLSAQVHHLQHVVSCAEDALSIINEFGFKPKFQNQQGLASMRSELTHLFCFKRQDPLSGEALMETTPLEEDYPIGHTHTCAACGQEIALGQEVSATASFTYQGKKHSRHYYRHSGCKVTDREQLRTYKDKGGSVKAPTYAELLLRLQMPATQPLVAESETQARLSLQEQLNAVR